VVCDARSVVLTECEQQLAVYFDSFTIPADYRAQLRAYVASEASPADDLVGQRQRLEARLARCMVGAISNERTSCGAARLAAA
jgi:hypothetical protein